MATLCVWLGIHKPADAACLNVGILVKTGVNFSLSNT